MTSEQETTSAQTTEQGIAYEIKIKGHLEEHWSDWFGGLAITHDAEGNSLFTGFVPDQSALHGILSQIRDLGLTLISITPRSDFEEQQTPTNN